MDHLGPESYTVEYLAERQARIPGYCQREQVRPGITGLAQVYLGSHGKLAAHQGLDLQYIARQSWWLDLSILATTPLAMLSRTGR